MSCLVTVSVVREDGELLHDETVPVEVNVIEQLEKDFWVLGIKHTFRLAFDPGVRTEEAPCRT